jgi:hypothetical protein
VLVHPGANLVAEGRIVLGIAYVHGRNCI